MLISQTKRCGEILKLISKKKIKEDNFFNKTNFQIILSEIIENFEETASKVIELNISKDSNKINVMRSPELIYGLRNFIGNAVKFSRTKVEIKLMSNKNDIEILINDDGPGFPEDIKEFLGEPYIKSKSKSLKSNAGTGLGTFLGKTLLERKLAYLQFSEDNKLGGASVIIKWKIKDLEAIS